ncbi:MAG: hypothetical protein WC780_02105 [Lentimicrobiaceae bacterium]
MQAKKVPGSMFRVPVHVAEIISTEHPALGTRHPAPGTTNLITTNPNHIRTS